MAGQRQPGPWGLEPTPVVIDAGTSPRIRMPLPGPTGVDDWRISLDQPGRAATAFGGAAADSLESLKETIAGFRRSESWAKLQPIVFQVAGRYSFGLGVLYGVGENVVGSAVELGQLAKTFLLADLYDRAHQRVVAAAFGPTAIFQRLMAEASMRAFGAELEEAHRERDELIAELRYAMTHLGEVVGNIADSYVSKWNRFEALSKERTLSGRFEAGRIFGEVLLEVVSLIAGGAAAVKAAGKIPRLAKLARVRIAPRSRPHVGRGAGEVAAEKPVMTPSQARAVEAPAAEPPPVKPPPPTSAAARLAGSEFNGVKAERIRPGSDTKVAVIGRNMEAVEKYAYGLKKEYGFQPEVFAGDKISKAADFEWTELMRDHAPNRVPDSTVRNSLLFRENQVWVQKLVDQGYTVIDIGNPAQRGVSQFYEMEKGLLFSAK